MFTAGLAERWPVGANLSGRQPAFDAKSSCVEQFSTTAGFANA
jgi:hypothetical protein